MKATLIQKKSYHKQYWTQLSTTSNLVFINTCLRSDMFIVGWLLASRGAVTDRGGGARSKPLACGWQFLVRWHKLITVSIKVIKTCKKVYIVWFSGNHYQTKFDLGSYSRSLRMRKQQSKRIWKFHSVQKSSLRWKTYQKIYFVQRDLVTCELERTWQELHKKTELASICLTVTNLRSWKFSYHQNWYSRC